jgi:signal transduction histidine kinase
MDEVESVAVGKPGAFWPGFTVGWLVYVGVIVSFEVAAGASDVGHALLIGLANAGPPALLSAVVATQRHRLLRPEWPISKTLLVHALVGVTYATATALAIGLVATLSGAIPEEMVEAGPWVGFTYRAVSAVFLYAIFFGFLMWAESIRRVQESQRLVAREAVLRARAEATAVRAQFNPHFVFNTLHSLMLLVRADPARAEQAIEDVATLIRYATIVQRRDMDGVPLAKELEVARRYVALEELRLQDRLHVTWRTGTGVEGFMVPAFALQTLVENAIKHGIEPNPGGGRVTIEAVTHGGEVRIRVEDDGCGAERSAVDAEDGHGLDLLRRRLDARYGTRGRLEWTTEPGRGFTAEMRLPAESAVDGADLDVITPRLEREVLA